MKGNPYPPPSPNSLAMMCAIHAWADDVDDDSRKLLEWSHDVIEDLMARLVRQARVIETLEATRQ
jgi:hypothetical protein